MSLFAGLGLLGLAFAMDGAKSAPYNRAERKLDRKYGPDNPRCFDLKWAVKYGDCFENEDKPIISRGELNRIVELYKKNKIPFPYNSAVHDVAKLAAKRRGFEYTGWPYNVQLIGPITDEENIIPLGIL